MEPDVEIKTQRQFLELLERALSRTEKFSLIDPSFSLFQIIRAQLEFMRAKATAGVAPSPADRDRVDVGVRAVRELEESDPEYAKWLVNLNYAFRHWETLQVGG
jgi:hypothetical protein